MVDRLSVVGSILGCAIAWFLFWLWPNIRRAIPPFFNTRQRSAALLLFLWLAADLCGARAADKYYAHYFLPSLLSLIVISCLSIDVLAKLISSIKHSQLLIYIVLIPIGIAGLKGQIDYFHSASRNPPDEWKQAGLFIRDHKSPSDVTFTWGFRPGVYRIADSHTLTRWADAHYIDDFPGAYKSIGSELISELNLKYNDKLVTLEFTTVDLINVNKVKFRYKIEGFNNQWIPTQENKIIMGLTPLQG